MAAKTKDVTQPASQPAKLSDLDAALLAAKVTPADATEWREVGARCATRDEAGTKLAEGAKLDLDYARKILTGATREVWIAFKMAAIAGASLTHKHPDQLISRSIIVPLSKDSLLADGTKLAGITMPASPTSSAQRPAEVAKKTAAEQAAEAIAKMTGDEIEAAIKAGDARTPLLFAALGKRAAAKLAEEKKANVEAFTKAKKPIVDMLGTMTPGEMVTLHGFMVAIIGTRNDPIALAQYCAKVSDAYANAKQGKRKAK